MLKLTTRTDDDGSTYMDLYCSTFGGCCILVPRIGDDELAALRTKAELLDWLIAKTNEKDAA